VLKQAKLSMLALARTAHLYPAIRDSRWRRHRLLILGYHGVSIDDEHRWDPELFMSPATLRARFEAIRRGGYTVLPLGVAVERLYADDLPPRAVALTFDDGLYDFARNVVPLLSEFQYPAAVYVSTYYAKRGGPVFDPMVRYLLWKSRRHSLDAAGLTDGGDSLDVSTPEARRAAGNAIVRFAAMRDLDADAKDAILRTIAERGEVRYHSILEQRILHLMTPDEIRSLPTSLVDVQLHTHRHRVPLEREKFVSEVAENRAQLRSMGINGPERTHFCYPSGVTHPRFLPWLEALGVTSATTCVTGLASRTSHRLLLPRLVDTSALTPLEFEGWLTGVSAFLPRRPMRKASGAELDLGVA
jgi:peptidoglycan/xylan/chitin deacetylase (PgdA/CDA1 family)